MTCVTNDVLLESNVSPRAPSVLILKDTVSVHSGTSKVLFRIADGFRAAGWKTKVVAFSLSSDAILMEHELRRSDLEIIRSPVGLILSKALELPVIRFFENSAFTTEDSVNILDQLASPRLRHLVESADLVVFTNVWSALISTIVPVDSHPRSALIHHEPPVFDEIPQPLRKVLRRYVTLVSKRVNVNIAITQAVADVGRQRLGIPMKVLPFGLSINEAGERGGDFVLFDTRWTYERDPMFAIDLAREMPDFRFVMAGTFPSKVVYDGFVRAAKAAGVTDRITVRTAISETDRANLYRYALCVARWGTKGGETGSPLAIHDAIAWGCVPVLTSDIGIAPVISDNISPELVVSKSARGFAQVIRHIATDPSFRTQLISSVKRYRDSHSWRVYADELANLAGAPRAPP